MANIDLLLRDVKSTTLTIDKIKLSDIIVINAHVCNNLVISRSCAKPPKYHIIGTSIFDKKKSEILCDSTHLFVKILPLKCDMNIVTIEDNKCDLDYHGNIFSNVELPKRHIDDILIAYREGLKISVSVDNYLDTLCKINEYWI